MNSYPVDFIIGQNSIRERVQVSCLNGLKGALAAFRAAEGNGVGVVIDLITAAKLGLSESLTRDLIDDDREIIAPGIVVKELSK